MTKVLNSKFHKPILFKPQSIKESIVLEQFKSQLTPEEQSQSRNNIQSNLGEDHPFDYVVIEGVLQKFGLVNAVVDKISDFTLGGGLYIESDDEDAVSIIDDWRNETNFDIYLKPWFKEGLSKGSGFLEIAGLGNASVQNMVKVPNANGVYLKRDKFGNIIETNQYIGNSTLRINSNDIISLNKDEIIHLPINKIGSSAYGQGIVYSALTIINDFLMAQKSIHILTKRKANAPVHWKLGNADKDDYPEQSDINAFGQDLQFMNESTEYVTGPNAEPKVIDYGNIGDKFTTVLENDYKLLSYSFQVPEIIMGSKDTGGSLGSSGISNVQLDSFIRRCKSYQTTDINPALKYIFDKVLLSKGKVDVDYKICWGYLSDEEKNKRLETYKNLLSSNISAGLRVELEKKIAYELEIDYEEVDTNNEDDMQKQIDMQKALQKPAYPSESLTEAMFKKKKRKSYYTSNGIHEATVDENTKVTEWLNKDITNYKNDIIEMLNEDIFEYLLAENHYQRKAGYLTKTEIRKLKKVFSEAIVQNKSIKEIKEDITKLDIIKELKDGDVIKLSIEKRIDMIAKSELTRILNNGFVRRFEQDKDIVVRWDATIDELTCPICHELNNRMFDVGTLTQDMVPPIHPNCRCNLTEVSQEAIASNRIIQDALKDKKGPQEIALELVKQLKIDEEKANKFVDSYLKWNK